MTRGPGKRENAAPRLRVITSLRLFFSVPSFLFLDHKLEIILSFGNLTEKPNFIFLLSPVASLNAQLSFPVVTSYFALDDSSNSTSTSLFCETGT